jgi:hypothetical protein
MGTTTIMKTQNTFIALALFITAFTFGQNTFPPTGNVGTTTTPAYLLDINSTNPYIRIRSSVYTLDPAVLTRKGGIIFNQENQDKTAAISYAIPPGYHVPGILFSTKTAWNTPGPGEQDWYDRMFLHPNGNLGIGTTAPSAKLDVNGSVVFDDKSSPYTNIRIGHDANDAIIADNLGNKAYGGGYWFRVHNETAGAGKYIDVMALTEAGKVGVGTNSPSAKLESYNTTAGVTAFKTSGLNGYLLVDNVGSGENYYSANKFHDFQTAGGASKMRITESGSVGIGTTLPTAKLHINNGNNSYGAILANSSELPFSLYTKTISTSVVNGESFRLGLKYDSNENNGFISFYRGGDTSGGFLGLSTNGSERMRIDQAGFVGIGTNSPDAKLTVNGQIHTKEVRIDLLAPMTVPDYVFANDYKLKTLNEVDNYIKANNHLPEIPSAKEIEKNGLMVAEMNLSLLKKIEELTLYAIEQQKKLEAQNKINETLAKQLELLGARLTSLEKK